MDLVHTNCYLVSFSPYYHRRNLEADVFVYQKKKTQLAGPHSSSRVASQSKHYHTMQLPTRV